MPRGLKTDSTYFVHPGVVSTSTSVCISGSGSNTTLEDIAEAVKGSPVPLWIQFYIYKDRDLTARLIRRAERAGYKALFVTVDLPVMAKRRMDIKNEFTLPKHLR